MEDAEGMSKPRSLGDDVVPQNAAERLLEATLPPAADHRAGDTREIESLLAASPAVATADIWVAAATGTTDAAAQFLADDPGLAKARGSTRNWEPLLYLCFSQVLRDMPERRAAMHTIAAGLLEAGADPNAFWIDPAEGQGNRETCIYGAAGIANDPELTGLLIEAGADPNDGETAYHFVEHDGVPCAEILWPHFDAMNRGTALLHKLDYADLGGIQKLLELGADPNGPSPFGKTVLHQAVFRGHPKTYFDLLLAHGADPDRADRAGRTPYACAARAGRGEVMEWLAAAGATTELNRTDEFIAACAGADATRARAMLDAAPTLVADLNVVDRAQICEAADAGNTAGVRLMLDLGWNVDTLGPTWSEAAIHRAAMQGHVETVELLYERGADLTVRDRAYSASPLGWASHGGHAEIVRYLAQDPARLDARDRDALASADSD
jgi:ankyrin repeat protein